LASRHAGSPLAERDEREEGTQSEAANEEKIFDERGRSHVAS
jgi:hypothetical protein